MKTVGQIVRLSVDYVQQKGGRPRHEVEEWIAHTLGLRRLDLYLQFDRPIDDTELMSIRAGIARLSAGEPLAYITKKAPFYGLEFEVCSDVLIPRPETETLITVVKGFIASKTSPGTIVDVCTGSGCIGLTLKMLFPQWHVVLTDICDKALNVARKNAQKLNLDVEILQGNLLEPFSGRKAEVIVANPPYISSSEMATLDLSVTKFEPRRALEAGRTGMEMYQTLFSALPHHLVPNGFCAVEIGASQGQSVLGLAQSFGEPFLVQDLAGNDRVVAVRQYRTQ